MRIRTIKPEFWQNEDIAKLPDSTKLLAIGLLNFSDDEGYFKAHAKLIESQIFPFTDPSVSVHTSLIHLADIGYIEVKKGRDGKEYGRVVNFKIHQVVNRPKASIIKELFDCSDEALIDHGLISAGKEGKGREQGKEGEGNAQSEDRLRRIENSENRSENQNPTTANQPEEKAPPSSAAPPQKINNLQFIQADRFAQLYPDDPIAWPAMQLKFKIGNEKLKEILGDFVLHRKQSSKPTDTYQEFCKHIANWYRKKIENSSGGGGIGKPGGRDDFMKDYQ